MGDYAVNEPVPTSLNDDRGVAIRLPVSVIMPMRDAELYASAAIRQLRLLKPQPEQIIVILDGCRDQTKAAVESAGTGMDNLQLVEFDEAKGAGSARNAGIRAATSEYVWFCDCDDFWESDILDKLARAAKAADADMSVCAVWNRRDNSASKRISHSLSTKKIGNRAADSGGALDWLLWGDLSGHLWNKLIRRSLIVPTAFCDLYAPHEDLYAMLEIAASARRVVAIRDPLYTYVQRTGSHLTSDPHHARKLIPIRDRARAIVARDPAPAGRLLALQYFEARLIAMPILQILSVAESRDGELASDAKWARRAIRLVRLSTFIRRGDYLAACFAALVRTRLERYPYRVFRAARKNRPSSA